MTERILDRVRKLMALANDAAATEGERDNALRMAHATLAKYNLSMEQVPKEQQEARERHSVQLSVYPWARAIAHTIGGLFFCSYYFQRPSRGKLADHFFIGRQSNAITATEMSAYVINSVFKELRTRYGTDTSPEARSFATGVADRLRHRVYELQRAAQAEATASGSGALVVVELYKSEKTANDAWVQSNVGDLRSVADRTKSDVRGSAYGAGKAHGDKINLSGQIAGGRSNSKLKRLG